MFGTFLDKLNMFFDRRFILAYWSPLFITLTLAAGLAVLLAGPTVALGWWKERNGTEQLVIGGGILLVITVLANLSEAFTTPIVRFYEGYWPKGALLTWARKFQKYRKDKASKSERYHLFPLSSELLKPTRLGNVLMAAEEYPQQLYQLDAVLWWPRLTVLLPDSFRAQVDTALTPMLALLNLSVQLTILAFGGGIAVLLTNRLWWLFILAFLGGFLLSWGCYRAASIAAVEYGKLVRVAFDLYRYDVLKQMHIPLPDNFFQERLLWDMLNKWLYYYMPLWQIDRSDKAPPTDPFYNDIHEQPASATN